ncbi:NVEALA domain-containing protein [Bacteroides faecichinchillae]|uniref:NVEALA domain-containing protein n=1 Tax=Bacteroides faecichinchillae TaxID=871325 RepID=UPI0009DD66C1|nr:NVEALA domain-containing protein [Bacteroides faecichinchillae]THG69793.1 hypothetical protein E5981_00915 [Bacteroides faecichinchillae]
MICIVLTVVIISVAYQKQKSKTILGDIVLLNIEALAQDEGDGNCAEWITKNCYEVFTSEYGSDYYASCAPTTMGGMAECGAIESHKPAGMSQINTCLECIRQY